MPLSLSLSLFLAAGLLAACGADDDSTSTDRTSAEGRGDHMTSMDGMGGHHGDSSDVAEGAREIEVTGSSFASGHREAGMDGTLIVEE